MQEPIARSERLSVRGAYQVSRCDDGVAMSKWSLVEEQQSATGPCLTARRACVFEREPCTDLPCSNTGDFRPEMQGQLEGKAQMTRMS